MLELPTFQNHVLPHPPPNFLKTKHTFPCHHCHIFFPYSPHKAHAFMLPPSPSLLFCCCVVWFLLHSLALCLALWLLNPYSMSFPIFCSTISLCFSLNIVSWPAFQFTNSLSSCNKSADKLQFFISVIFSIIQYLSSF